jgi:hypothetical protein
MSYAILLDIYVGLYGPDEYAISDFGTLEFCRTQTTHDGTTFPAPESHYKEGASEPKSLRGLTGNDDTGRIVELTVA